MLDAIDTYWERDDAAAEEGHQRNLSHIDELRNKVRAGQVNVADVTNEYKLPYLDVYSQFSLDTANKFIPTMQEEDAAAAGDTTAQTQAAFQTTPTTGSTTPTTGATTPTGGGTTTPTAANATTSQSQQVPDLDGAYDKSMGPTNPMTFDPFLEQTEEEKQQYANAASNRWLTSRKRCWATQTDTYTNPNTSVLQRVGDVLVCNNNNVACTLTSDADVPGKIETLCYNPTVPLYNYKVTRTYSSGGTKWPQYHGPEPPPY